MTLRFSAAEAAESLGVAVVGGALLDFLNHWVWPWACPGAPAAWPSLTPQAGEFKKPGGLLAVGEISGSNEASFLSKLCLLKGVARDCRHTRWGLRGNSEKDAADAPGKAHRHSQYFN